MVTSCPLGTSGFQCSIIIYLIPALFVVGCILFRKNIANDLFDLGFSLIGSCVVSILVYYIIYGVFENIKFSVVAGIIGMIIGGFLLAPLIGDGET